MLTLLRALPENSFTLHFNRDLNGVSQGLNTVDGLATPQNDACKMYGENIAMGLSACRLTLAAYAQEAWYPTETFGATVGLRFTRIRFRF